MRRKFRSRQKTGIRISLRTLLYAGTVAAIGMIVFSFFVVSVLKEEESPAGTHPMVVTGLTVTQDIQPVYSGMRDVPVLKITVTTKGTGNRLSLTDMTFSARGTSRPVHEVISNARLWYTSGENVFSMSRQYGQTLAIIADEDFTFSTRQLLQEGNNYFWLAVDTESPVGKDLRIDAEMIRSTIGTLVLEPDLSAPSGYLQLLSNTPWYSTGNTEIASLESWNSRRDGSGNRPVNFSRSSGTFHIQAGHIMYNKLNACLPSIIIERNGSLINETTISADLVLVNPGGTLINKTKFSGNSKLNKLIIKNGGMYVHDTDQGLPADQNEFSENSTITFLQCPVSVDLKVTDFGNVVIASGKPGLHKIHFPFTQIKGDLEFRGTGSDQIFNLTSEQKLQVAGDLIVNNAALHLSGKEKLQQIAIGKKFYIKNGHISDGGSPVQIVMGDQFLLKEGSFLFSHTGSSIIIKKHQTEWYQSGRCELPDVILESGASLNLQSATFGNLNAGRKLTVQSGARLNCGRAVVTGSGNLELEAGGMLVTSHPEGICSGGNSGSIQTAGRYFSSEASYQFSGSSSPQNTGVFETAPEKRTVKEFIISKDDISGVVVLQSEIKFTGSFIKTRGSLNKNGYTFGPTNTPVAETVQTKR